jgi:predicted phage gp36 major capsid-like protein
MTVFAHFYVGGGVVRANGFKALQQLFQPLL